MKYTMKMVLIPESEYRRLQPEGGIKSKVNDILKGKRDREAATEMSQLFGRYLRTTRPEKEVKTLSKEEISNHFSPIYREKIVKFLTEMEKYGSTWTDNFNFITKSGESIGDIRELLKETFVGTRTLIRNVPQGWPQFVKEIVDANVKRNIFTKTSTKEDLALEKASIKQSWANY